MSTLTLMSLASRAGLPRARCSGTLVVLEPEEHIVFSSRKMLLVIALLCSTAAGKAETTPQAVYVDVCIAEQDVNSVMRKVHEPLFAVLEALPGRGNISGASTHGKAQFQIQFQDGATRNDVTAVEEALKRIAFAEDVEILSVHVELGQPRDDGLFVGRLACTRQPRR
jgi:hypothetical protein